YSLGGPLSERGATCAIFIVLVLVECGASYWATRRNGRTPCSQSGNERRQGFLLLSDLSLLGEFHFQGAAIVAWPKIADLERVLPGLLRCELHVAVRAGAFVLDPSLLGGWFA